MVTKTKSRKRKVNRKRKVKHMINMRAKVHIGHKNVQIIVTLPVRILRRRLARKH